MMDLPTASGKTACIDVALFHWLVAASSKPPAPWLAARRIVFVVDRRIIVDEATTRARRIAEKIAKSSHPILAEARELLTENRSEGLGVFTLRGGVARERNLARDPLSVSVVISTVDQIGSRLLFRGYGVSDRMRPIHAGLFGMDTLLLLDEAHIAEPFQKTLRGIVREQNRNEAQLERPRPLRWVQLSATHSGNEHRGSVFSLDREDRRHRVLKRRIDASKPMRLLTVEDRNELSTMLAELVQKELDAPPLSAQESSRIGVIVNRVATARALFETLEKALEGRAEVELLIGRVRPAERDPYLETLAPKLKSDEDAREGKLPIVVIATQTIEVGADFDFHAIYTEAASYPALKQRVGRLNRLGVRTDARGAIVLVRADAEDDPIYGETILETWALLEKHAKRGVVDLGIAAAPSANPKTIPRSPETPELSPSLLALLVQTCPEPAVEPDIAEFLHGFATQVPDISVVWRDGLFDGSGPIDRDRAAALLEVLPPLSTEAMSLPYSSFRQWVSSWTGNGTKVNDNGDMEGDPPIERTKERIDTRVLVVIGKDVWPVPAGSIRPGSLVVVSCRRGGADKYGFHPTAKETVDDLSLRARMPPKPKEGAKTTVKRRREQVLVWTPELAKDWAERANTNIDIKDLVDLLHDPDATSTDARTALETWLDEYEDILPEDVRKTREALPAHPRVQWLGGSSARFGIVLRKGRPQADDLVEGASLQRTVPISLAKHLKGVGELAARYAKAVGFGEELVAAMGAAGRFHDLGKADPRFQRRLGAREGDLLAKSNRYDSTVARGERHEAYSVAMLDQHPDLLKEIRKHRDLVRYLVGTHHGHGRALHPYADDVGIAFEARIFDEICKYQGRPALHGLAAGWADLFIEQNRKYGPWLLAYLESILRLADFVRSNEEIEEYEEGGDE